MHGRSMKSAALFASLAGIAGLLVDDVAPAQLEPTKAGGATRRERTAEQSAERISARQRKKAAKAFRRAERAALAAGKRAQ